MKKTRQQIFQMSWNRKTVSLPGIWIVGAQSWQLPTIIKLKLTCRNSCWTYCKFQTTFSTFYNKDYVVRTRDLLTTYHLIQLPEVYLQYIMIQSSFIIIAAQRLSHESHVSYVSQQRPAVLPLVPRVETFATKGPTNDLAAFKGKAPDFHQRSQYLVPMEISLQMPHGLKQRQPPGSAPLLGTCETQVPRGRKLSEMMLRMQFREQRVKFGQMVQCSNLQIVKQCAAKQRMSTFYIQYSVEGRRSERPFSKKTTLEEGPPWQTIAYIIQSTSCQAPPTTWIPRLLAKYTVGPEPTERPKRIICSYLDLQHLS